MLCPNHHHMTVGMLWQPQLWGAIISFITKCPCNFEQVIIKIMNCNKTSNINHICIQATWSCYSKTSRGCACEVTKRQVQLEGTLITVLKPGWFYLEFSAAPYSMANVKTHVYVTILCTLPLCGASNCGKFKLIFFFLYWKIKAPVAPPPLLARSHGSPGHHFWSAGKEKPLKLS